MIHLDINRCLFLSEIMLLGLAFLSGCNRDSASDFAKKQKAQENAVVALTDLGAKITKLNNGEMKGWSVDLNQIQFDTKIADQLKVMESSIRVLDLRKTSIDDSQLADLVDKAAITSVVELNLSYNPAITDRSLEKLDRLVFLRDLDLTGTQVTEGEIARLRDKRKQVDFKPDDQAKDSVPKILNRPVPKYLKREFKIRH